MGLNHDTNVSMYIVKRRYLKLKRKNILRYLKHTIHIHKHDKVAPSVGHYSWYVTGTKGYIKDTTEEHQTAEAHQHSTRPRPCLKIHQNMTHQHTPIYRRTDYFILSLVWVLGTTMSLAVTVPIHSQWRLSRYLLAVRYKHSPLSRLPMELLATTLAIARNYTHWSNHLRRLGVVPWMMSSPRRVHIWGNGICFLTRKAPTKLA